MNFLIVRDWIWINFALFVLKDHTKKCITMCKLLREFYFLYNRIFIRFLMYWYNLHCLLYILSHVTWLWTGFGLVNGFVDHLYTWLVSTSKYSATTDLRNSQITTAPAKPFSACSIFTSHSLATASNSGDPSASGAKVLSLQPFVQNSLNWLCPLLITSQHGPRRNPHFHCCSPTVALLRICCLAMGTCLPSHCPETIAVYRVSA
jgi:hypothetical protein